MIEVENGSTNRYADLGFSSASEMQAKAILAAKIDAAEKLANVGLTISDAVRILLTRINSEGGLPAGLTADPAAHDAWFRARVQEAPACIRILRVLHTTRQWPPNIG